MGAFETGINDPESLPQPTESTASNSTSDANEIVSEPVPKKRKNRARRASIAIFSITAILVLVFCFATGKVVEYHPETSSSSTQNYTRCSKTEKYAFPGLFTTALGLLSIVLGTLVDRLSLVVEECHHLKERYNGSRTKMIKDCFSGIQTGPVVFLSIITFVIVVLLILLTGMPFFELRYLVTIFGGIGVGPLVMHLLSLNTQSKVHISTILEERGMYVANGLAWSYYFNYLKKALPKFKNMITSSPGTLSLNKLLLLIPLDCHTDKDLNELDGNIEKLDDIGNEHDPFRFPVYRLTANEGVHNLAIICVKEPLKTLDKMSLLEGIEAVKRQDREAEVKLLVRTLSQIIKSPPDQKCKETCLLLPIMTPTLERFQNGGLANAIMNIIARSPEQTDGVSKPRSSLVNFMRLEGVKKEGKQLKVDLDTSHKSNKASKRNTKQGTKTEDTKNSEGTTNNKLRNTSPNFDENACKKGKCLQRKYKEKKTEGTEQKKSMIPAENIDPSNTSKDKGNDKKQLVQEVERNDVGAGTSGYSLQVRFIAEGNPGSLPSDLDANCSSDDEHKPLHTSQL